MPISPAEARILITRRLHPAATDTLRAAGCRHIAVNEHPRPMRREELLTACAEADAVLCQLTDRIDEELLTACPRPRVFANYAVGFDNMDVAAATRHGVALANTPDVLTDATAEMAWALLLGAARRVGAGERLLRAGEFTGWDPLMLLGQGITGRTLGIIGAGRIGSAMARMAAGFKMSVLYTRRQPGESEAMRALGARKCNLDELLSASDFISVHAPLNAESRHLLGPAQFAQMRPHCVLVNTGRGPVIDEAALAEALATGQIAAAGIDVFEREPEVHPALLAAPNALLVPHLGSATHQAREAMGRLAAENLLAVVAGRPPLTCLNPDYPRP